MGQVLHGCATTTETVRRAIQNSQESLRALAKRYGINQKTVAKWKERETVADLPTGPREAKSTVLSIEEEASSLSGGIRCCRSTIASMRSSRPSHI
jgi:transposase-like protein